LAHCESLTALSLGALRNVTELKALRGRPSTTLRALLLETMPNLENLEDIGTCSALTQLGLYEARPKDKRSAPLQRLGNLAHLVLGDPYPTAEIEAFDAWYSGSFRYRDKIERGEIKPAWRTPIDTLDT
jgi:hypothetical protein